MKASAKKAVVAELQSEKNGKVAEFRAFNLQLFNDGGDVDDVATNEPTETNTSSDDLGDQPINDGSNDERNYEKDAAYAEMRRKAEEAEEYKEKYNQVNNFFKNNYGDEFGVDNFESFKEKMTSQRMEEKFNEIVDEANKEKNQVDVNAKMKELLDLHPEFNKIKQELNKYEEAAAKTVQKQNEKKEVTDLNNEHGLELQSYEDIKKLDNAEKILGYMTDSNLSLSDAYLLANKDIIQKEGAEKVRQQTMNQINGKSHIKPTKGTGEANKAGPIPKDQLAMYKQVMTDKNGRPYPDEFYQEYHSLSQQGKNPSVRSLKNKYNLR